MKRSLDHSSGSIKQLDASNSSVNQKTMAKTTKYALNYSPVSSHHQNNNYKAVDTILQSANYANRSSGYLRSSIDEDQNYTRDDTDYLSSTLDIKLLQKELTLTKKNLKEAQARANVLTHSNSKLQHQHDILEQQTQKAEKRCKELIEKLSSEQLKVNELNFLNKQIQKELDSYRQENVDTTERMKGNFETLKKKHDEYVELTELKITKVISQVKKCFAVVGQNDRLHQNKKPDFNQEIFLQLRKVFMNIASVLDDKNFDTQDDEVNILQEIKNIAMHKDSENMELKARLSQLQLDFDKETAHTKDVLPRYRESLEKLKQNSKLMREKIKELQDSKEAEKIEYEKKIKKIQLNYQQTDSEKSQLKNELKKLNHIMDEEQKESSSLVKEVGHLRKENSILKKKLEEFKGMIEDQENVIVDLRKEINVTINNNNNQNHNNHLHRNNNNSSSNLQQQPQQQQFVQANEKVLQQKGQRSSSHSPVNTRKEKDDLDFYLSKSPSEQDKTRRRKFFEESEDEQEEEIDDLHLGERKAQNKQHQFQNNQNVNKGRVRSQPDYHSQYDKQKMKSKHYQQDQDVELLSSDESEIPVKQTVYTAPHHAQRVKSKESIQNFMTFAESGHTSNNNTFNSHLFEEASNQKFQHSQKQHQNNNKSRDLYSFSQSKGAKSSNNFKQRENFDPYAKVNNSYGQDYSSNYQENDSSMQSYQKNVQPKKGTKGVIVTEIQLLDEEINQIKQYLADELEILNTDQNPNLYT